MMDFHHLKTQEARRKYILNEQNHKCNHCGLDTWREQPLTLELEHKDGNSQNNARENLECICPNCHSQTPTWRGRNKGNSKRISDEDFAAAIRECGTIHPALGKLGLAQKGGNYRRAKAIVEKFSLDVSYPSGHRSACAKLTQDQVADVRRLREEGLTLLAIAQQFGVSRSTIKGIISGITYRQS